jgi:multidrug efflux pump subunit AcrA (membrane-fusion protein)
MSRRRWLLAAAALAGLGGLGGLLLIVGAGGASEGIAAAGVPLFRAEQGALTRLVVAEGYLKAVHATPISAPVESGQAQRIGWLAAEGSAVAAGDVIVRFDPTDLERNLMDGEADRAIAEHEIARSRLENDTKVGNLELDADVAEHERQQAERFAAKDAQIFSRQQILDAEIDQDLAEHKAVSAHRLGDATARQAQAQIDLLGIQRNKADLKIRQARQGLDALVVRAPHAGFLTLERDWQGNSLRAGDQVWPGQKLGEIPDPTAVEALVFVLEADAGGLAPALEGTLVVEAHPGRSYPARVTRVDALAKPLRWNVPVQYFEAALAAEGADLAAMKPGQRVRAEIVLERIPSALLVPPQAVVAVDGAEVCYRREGARLVAVEVKVGARGWDRVQILSGIGAGDEVALRDPTGRSKPKAREDAPAPPDASSGTSVMVRIG